MKKIYLLFAILAVTTALSQEEERPHTLQEFIGSITTGNETLQNATLKVVVDGETVKAPEKVEFNVLSIKELTVMRTESDKATPEKPCFSINITTNKLQPLQPISPKQGL